jgi:hypothetical protein
MPKYLFHMGVTLRCYGAVEIEAESIAAAAQAMTADYLADRIEITETTTDSGQDLTVIDVTDADGCQIYGEEMGELPPNPYDPPDTRELITAGRELAALWESRPVQSERISEATARLRAAIAKAEGRANG